MSEERATHLVPVLASIRHIVDFVSTLPVDFYRKSDNARVPASVPALIRNVEDTVGLDTWFGQIAYGLVTRGNAVGHVSAMGQSGPLMIEWADQWSSFGNGDDDPWFIKGRQFGPRSVQQVRWIVPPGKRLGLSPIEHYASMVRAGLAAQEYANIGRGGGLPLAEITNTALSEMPAELITAVQTKAAASFASGQPFVHGKDWKLSAVDIPPNQLQFLETLKLSANAIASIYGIDPREIGGSASESLTYTNDESRPLTRAHNLRPYLVRIENAVNRWISGPVYMKFNIDATIRADTKTRTEVVGAKIADGRMSVNEARALEDLEPVAGGDFHNVPSPKSDIQNGTPNTTGSKP
ncbi:MAG TPA: phage portal protein [Microbacteriaceae bacterium]|nr:phage portal protein [Microbacteriaceae bacterium]